MGQEKISDKQGVILIALFLFGSTLILGIGGDAQRDAWIAVALAILLAIPVTLMHARLLSQHMGLDMFDIVEFVLGKIAGKFFILLFTWFSFHLGALVLRNFGEFVNTAAMPETPKIVPMLIMGFLCIYAVKAGIESIARCGEFFIILVVILIVISSLLAIPLMDPDNIKPILGDGIKPVLKGTFSAFTFPFGETVILAMTFSSLQTNKSPYKAYIIGILFGGSFILFLSVRNIMILGPFTMASVYFPSYSALSRINIGNFLQRLEIAVTIAFLLAGFMKTSICLLAAAKGLSKLLGFREYRFLVTPLGLLMVNLGFMIYGSIMEMTEWAFKIWPYYAVPFQVLLPLIILVAAEIKLKLKSK